jgi:hypothetical protein
MRILTTLVLVALSWIGCAGTPKQPDWITGNSGAYPAAGYLIGRGQGPTSAVARDRARAGLAKNFRVHLTEESRDLLARASQTEGEVTTSRLESEVSRNIIARTDQIVEGVRVAEAWQDPITMTHHALAVLDRLQAGNKLRQTIAGLDSATQRSLEKARTSNDVLVKIGAATRALAAQVERAEYQRCLTVVDRSGVGVPPAHDAARLGADLGDLLERLRIAPRVKQDPLGGLKEVVAGALAHAGFLHETTADAQYVLDVNLQVMEHPGSGGWHWVRGTLDTVLTEGERVRGSHRWDIKASAQQKELASRRALEQIDQVLKRDLREVIVGFGGPEG